LTEGTATTVDFTFAGNPFWAAGGVGILSTAVDAHYPPGHDPGIAITDTNCTQTSGANVFILANWATEVGTLSWTCADNSVVEHPQLLEIRISLIGTMIPWVTTGCSANYDPANNISACTWEPVLYFNKVDPSVNEAGTIDAFAGDDTCEAQTIPYHNTGNIDLTLTVSHDGSTVSTQTIAPGASGILTGDWAATGTNGNFEAVFYSTTGGAGIVGQTKALDCRDTDGDTIYDTDEQAACINDADCDDDGVNDNLEQDPSCIEDADCDDDGLADGDDPDDLDNDIDNDTVLDGDEPTGCINDTDCDDDTILDGDEQEGCIDDTDCDDDGVLDGDEQDESCITDTDCDDDGLLDADDGDDLNPDQDDDGVLDGDEQDESCILEADCDFDGLGDAEDPDDLDNDIDDDNVFDGDEQEGCLNDADCDDDGVPDGLEQAPICITDADCDDDGLGDAEDNDDLNPDQDGDTVLDGEEQDPSCVTVADCDGDGTFDADDPDDLNPDIPAEPPEDTDGDGVTDENEQDDSCVNDTDCDDDNLGDLPDEDDLDPDQDDDGVLDGDEQAPICVTDPDCDDDGTGDADDEDDTEPAIPEVELPLTTDETGETIEPPIGLVHPDEEPGEEEDAAPKAEEVGETNNDGDDGGGGGALSWLFAGWGALMLYPLIATALVLTPWYLRFTKLAALAGGSGPWWIILWKRRRWWCCSCDEQVDKDDENCEECGHIFTDDYDKYRRYRSKKQVSFPTFRQYMGLVWASKSDKEALKRVATDEAHVMSLLEDLDSK